MHQKTTPNPDIYGSKCMLFRENGCTAKGCDSWEANKTKGRSKKPCCRAWFCRGGWPENGPFSNRRAGIFNRCAGPPLVSVASRESHLFAVHHFLTLFCIWSHNSHKLEPKLVHEKLFLGPRQGPVTLILGHKRDLAASGLEFAGSAGPFQKLQTCNSHTLNTH